MQMGKQLALPDTAKSVEARFARFHAENPHVYAELLRLARQAKDRGQRKIGIRMIWEVMRWNLTIGTSRALGDFKLNDHYHSRYARMLDRVPDLHGLFELRELKS